MRFLPPGHTAGLNSLVSLAVSKGRRVGFESSLGAGVVYAIWVKVLRQSSLSKMMSWTWMEFWNERSVALWAVTSKHKKQALLCIFYVRKKNSIVQDHWTLGFTTAVITPTPKIKLLLEVKCYQEVPKMSGMAQHLGRTYNKETGWEYCFSPLIKASPSNRPRSC